VTMHATTVTSQAIRVNVTPRIVAVGADDCPAAP